MNTTLSIGKSSKTNDYKNSRIYILGPTIGFILLLLFMIIFAWGQAQSNSLNTLITHTTKLKSTLTKLLSNLQDAETGQRGYLITQRNNYLEPYINATSNHPRIINKLLDLTKNNQEQKKNINHIEKLAQQKFNELNQTIELTKNKKYDEAKYIVNNDYGKDTMDKIRIIIHDMHQKQTNNLKQNQKKYLILQNLVWIVGIIVFFAFCIIAILIIRQLKISFKKLNDDQLELNKLNNQLLLSNQELDKFAYVASHDLKAPLRAIKSLSRWIEEDLKEIMQEESKENIGLLQNRIERMEALLDDLLAYARLGKQENRLTDVNSKLLVENIAFSFKSPDLDLNIKVDDSLPIFKANKIPLEQILRNLIDNAIKHHDRSSINIEVKAEESAEYIKFSVKDDGPGIAPEYHEQIFEIFKTLKPRDEVEGSGMGLAIIKKMISMYSGKIHVESQTGIRGTNFIFYWKK